MVSRELATSPWPMSVAGAILFSQTFRHREDSLVLTEMRTPFDNAARESLKFTYDGLQGEVGLKQKTLPEGIVNPSYEIEDHEGLEGKLSTGLLAFVFLMNSTTETRLRRRLVKGIMEFETQEQVVKGVRSDVFEDAHLDGRSGVLASTSTTIIMGTSALSVFRRSGVVRGKTWQTILDGRERKWHQDAHGQTVPLGDKFIVKGELMDGPGDPAASAGNLVNCRCSVLSDVDPQFLS